MGAAVTDAMGRQAPEGLLGIHVNLLVTVLGGPQPRSPTRNAPRRLSSTRSDERLRVLPGAATRPETIGYAPLDSPVALAAWLLDHDTDSYVKIARAFVDGEAAGNLTRDTILDNITLCWLTGTGASAARSYWEDGQALAAAAASGQAPPEVSVPTGFTTFPGEIWRTPRSWAKNSYPNLTYFNEVDRAATLPPGKSRSSSPPRCEPPSGQCADDAVVFSSPKKDVQSRHRPLISSSSRISKTSEGRVSSRTRSSCASSRRRLDRDLRSSRTRISAGRPVCRFVPEGLERKAFWLAPEQITDQGVPMLSS